MNRKISHFQKILEHKHPDLYRRVGISVELVSNYHQYQGVGGRMREELNYNSPVTYEYTISFPNIGTLYYDISDYVRFVWGCDDVRATFVFNGSNYFKFTI